MQTWVVIYRIGDPKKGNTSYRTHVVVRTLATAEDIEELERELRGRDATAQMTNLVLLPSRLPSL